MTDTARELTAEEAASAERRRIGRVIAAEGDQILVLLDKGPSAPPPPPLGAAVILSTAEGGAVVAMVTALSAPSPAAEGDAGEIWIAETELCGALREDGFVPGVPRVPSLGDEACAATGHDMAQLLGAGRGVAELGTAGEGAAHRAGVVASALKDGLGVFGRRGSGKSCAVVSVVRSLIKSRSSIRPVLLDARGEYRSSFGRAAVTVSPAPGMLPFWILEAEELGAAFAAVTGPLSAPERSLLRLAVAGARRAARQREEGAGQTAARKAGLAPYRLSDLSAALEAEGAMAGGAAAGLHSRLAAARGDEALAPLFGGDGGLAALSGLLRDVFGHGGGGLACVVEMDELTCGLDRLFVSVLSRLALTFGGAGSGRETLFVVEDAERYLRAEDDAALSRHALSELARLGPGRGLGLCVVASRPSELPAGILSGLGSVVLTPPAGEAELDALRAAVPGRALSALSPACLGEGEIVVWSRSSGLPCRVALDPLPEAALPQTFSAKAPRADKSPAALRRTAEDENTRRAEAA